MDALGNRKTVRLSQRVYACATALRLEDRLEGPTDVMRLDRKVVWRLDHKRRTYRQVTFGEPLGRRISSLWLSSARPAAVRGRSAVEILLVEVDARHPVDTAATRLLRVPQQ